MAKGDQKDCNSNLLLASSFLTTLDTLMHDCERHEDKRSCQATSTVRDGYFRMIRSGLLGCVDKKAIDWTDEVVSNAVSRAKELV